MKKNFILAMVAIVSCIPVCHATGQSTNSMTDSIDVNAETNSAVTTSMNGNTSTNSGAPISSTAASSESRNASGSGN